MSHVILVAVEVEAATRHAAMEHLKRVLPVIGHAVREPGGVPYVESWWLAEDDRTDGSDLDSAIFVNKGMADIAHHILLNHRLTEPWNRPSPNTDQPTNGA